MMRIVMVGAGYVGLVSGACFSEIGLDVTCVDSDKDKIDMLLDGALPIYEPGLDRLVSDNVAAGRLHFTSDLTSAVKGAKVIFERGYFKRYGSESWCILQHLKKM